jgi:SAM-dependent methyltransferase
MNMNKSLDFYNKFDQKLIHDYANGNLRIENAIVSLSKWIPESTSRILDIGCGIGWSSHEFAKHFANAEVDGIDLSNVLIETAQKLFEQPNLSFGIRDVTNNLPETTYDAIILIDVYEHIPAELRKNFNKGLKNLLSDKGRIILACPSKFHQEYLRENNPEGLQPVDEDIDAGVLIDLARETNTELIHFAYQKIWNSFDYLYAVLENNTKYNGCDKIEQPIKLQLEKKVERISRINTRLGLNIQFKTGHKNKTVINSILKKLKGN